MSQNVWTRLDVIARGLTPVALTLLFIMASMVPLRMPGLSPVVPSLGLISVYFWVVHQPDLMPGWVVFLIGLTVDLLTGGPLGVNVFVLLMLYAALATQHRVFTNGSFMLMWLIFLPVAAGVFLLTWIFSCLIAGTFIGPEPVVFQYLTTVAFYPCLAWVFAQAQRAFLR